MKQFITLTKLELLNLFGLNVLRHVKDPAEKKKKTFMAIVLLIVVLILGGYLTASAYSMAIFGVGDKIPEIYSLLASIFLLIFGLFKAKSSLYRDKDLALLSSLPIKSFPIAAARLVHVYVENLLIGAIIILPTFLVSAIYCKAGAAFYLNMLLAIFLLPILPTALMAWFGIAVAALVARNRHKVLTETIFVLIVVVASLLLPMVFSSMNVGGSGPMKVEFFSKDASSDEVTRALSLEAQRTFDKMETSFPFLKTWGACLLGENILGFLLYGAGSAVLFLLTALLIGKNFFAISAKLFPPSMHHEFQMKAMHSETLLMALVRKEAKRYFSSGIYVTNTIVGPVFALVMTIALAFFDPKTLLATAGNLPIDVNANAALPFILGLLFCIMTPAASSLSIEGKNWWILQTLPVATKDIMQAKLLFSLMFMAPFYFMSELILLFTVSATLIERLWLLIVPAVAILFAVTFGLFCNVKFPKFQWESEVEVVKQSAATGLSMLGILVILLPMFPAMLLPTSYANIITLCAIALFLALTGLLYRSILRARL
jgi:ABC-2 type transport system permease protein